MAALEQVFTLPTPATGAGTSDARAMLDLFEGHHRGLRTMVSRLHSLTRQTVPADVEARAQWRVETAAAITDLRGFSELHFAEEEKLMEDVGFPGHDSHAAEHRAFIGWLDCLDVLLDSDARRLRQDAVGQAMATWWAAHGNDYDAPLAAFLCRGGI